MPDDTPRRRGRPRQHADDAARKRAYRDRWILTKVTTDVPDALTDHLRSYAGVLRGIDVDFRLARNDLGRVLEWKKMRGEDGLHVRLRNGALRGEVRARGRDAGGRGELFEWAVVSRHQRVEPVGGDKLKSSGYRITYAKGVCASADTARMLCEVALLASFSEHTRFDYARLRERLS